MLRGASAEEGISIMGSCWCSGKNFRAVQSFLSGEGVKNFKGKGKNPKGRKRKKEK